MRKELARWGSYPLFAMATFAGAGCTPRTADESSVATANLTSKNTAGQGLVVSQVYGGAGGTGAVWNRDFVELFNRTRAPIALAGLSIHYSGATSDLAMAGNLPADAVVPAGGYYLVGFAAGQTGADLRTDAAGLSVNILPANGKIALVRDVPVDKTEAADAAVQLLGCGGAEGGRCSNPRIIDFVGYGAASDHEGKTAAPAPSVANAIERKGAGCTDSDHNGNDFEASEPTPRSSKAPPRACEETSP